jgi:NAD(P)-dependent dehydrogenase (short-subunit alcohol dehydrogenase family)
MSLPSSLASKRVVITGAARGLGRALAIKAADQGADIVLLGRDPAALGSVVAAIKARSARDAMVVPCDLGRPDSIQEACARTLATAPIVDVLINNGAPWLPGSIEDLADADIATTIAAAVTGTVLVTKGLLPGLRQSKAADIVTIVSTAGLPGPRGGTASAAFHAAKHGQSGFSERLQEELKMYGIRATAIYPPDFDDTDPLDVAWDVIRDPATGAKLTNREVVAAVMFAITAPRVCAYPVIILDNMSPE